MAFNYKTNYSDSLKGKITVEDPIYGLIDVEYPYSEIVKSKEMQRLGHISQNGFSQYEFPGLKYNDRLSHSVGAFHVMQLILERLEKVLKIYDIELSQDDKDIALCSMLLHDIGHGPFSHSLELITNYSHEKRTTDILLGNTEISKLLTELYGDKKVKQIASFIAEINNQEDLGKDSFTKLLNNLVSHQLDADRLDYLVRDAYYVGINSSINLKRIIKNLNVVVNKNQEYELLIHRNGLSSTENVLIQRYQMYRDIYLSAISVLGDELFKILIDKYRNNPKLQDLPVTPAFKILAQDPSISNLNDFLQMTDDDFHKSFQVLMNNDIDQEIAYLSTFANLSDYVLIENDVSVDKIKELLKEIFGDINLENTLSIIQIKNKNKLYKKEQSLHIQLGNKIADISDCTNLIRPQEILESTVTFFNPEILRIELRLTKEEFKKYESEVERMLEELNKKPEEFELKYIVNEEESEESLLEKLKEIFTSNGFNIVSINEKENCDEYFDTSNLDLYSKGGSLRIRQTTNKDKIKYKGTYKMPLGEGEVFSSRTEIEESLKDSTFEAFESKMHETGVPVDFEQIIKRPILNSTTKRCDVVLEKNGVQVCLSLDNSTYTNHFLGEVAVNDKMIEIVQLKCITSFHPKLVNLY